MRLAVSLQVLLIGIAIVGLVGGCSPHEEQKAAPTAVAGWAPAPVATSQAATVAPAVTFQAPTAVPAATPQPTPPPPAPSPTMARGVNQTISLSKASPSAPVGQPLAPPQRLEIPSVGVNAPVAGLGLMPDGALDAPKNPDSLGWYQDGPMPGENGNALIDGHVDWAGKVRAFWYLNKLRPGDSIFVTDSNGNRHEFTVQWSKMYDANASVQDLFAQSGQPELTLITCGGQFDKTTHQYLSRLAVRALLK